MTSPERLACISSEGSQLLGYARRDPDRVVPQYPSWTLRDLVAHLACIHARTATICTSLPQQRSPTPPLPESRDPVDWFEETLPAMVAALGDADTDAEVWTLTPERRIGAWERRMLVETGVHRWDAQQALETPDPLVPLVATSGLDEFADLWLPRLGDVPTLELTAYDLGRSWLFGPGRPIVSATGSASDLYLRLMARPGAQLPTEWQVAVDGLASPAA